MLILEYPKCSTCKKAIKFLKDNNIDFTDRDIVKNNPTVKELKNWISKSGKDIKKFYNTSGMKYRELRLKEKLEKMTDEEKIELLSTDGMLVKRPLLISEDKILTGFREKEWRELIK
ncbi:MAG: arsenate reductase family protein [Bacilli bacterium]|nr:arsenate reductase family protein [Bacilli bacterium]